MRFVSIRHTSRFNRFDDASHIFMRFLFRIGFVIPRNAYGVVSVAYCCFCRLSCLFHFCDRYSTVYTNFPVFSLVMDKDVKPALLMTYPELYKELSKVQEKLFCDVFLIKKLF